MTLKDKPVDGWQLIKLELLDRPQTRASYEAILRRNPPSSDQEVQEVRGTSAFGAESALYEACRAAEAEDGAQV